MNNDRVCGYTCVQAGLCSGQCVRALESDTLSQGDKYLGKVGKPRPGDKISHLKEEGAERENQPAD